jgi:hypothetical protein
MRTLPALVFTVLLAVAAPLGLTGCNSEDAGQTLTITAPSSTGAYASEDWQVSAQVVYLGKNTLGYSWALVNGPAAVSFDPGVATSGGTNPGTTMNFGAAGTYVVRLTVYEVNGLISESKDITFTVFPARATASG